MSHSTIDFPHRGAGFWTGFKALGAPLLLVCLAAAWPTAFAADTPAPKGPEISRGIAKEITAAQKALQANQSAEALKNLEAAEAKPSLTPYDKAMINEFKGTAYIKMNNYKAAQNAYEAAVASGGLPAEEMQRINRGLFSLAANNQSPKAIEYGKQLADAGTATPNDLLAMTQLYYQQKNCKDSTAWSDKAIAAFRKAGEAPKEVLYQIKLQCASDASDTAGMVAALYDLVRLTNKTAYWNNLIRLERQDERDDHNILMIYRIMFDTGSMNADTDYIEMAQLLGDAALPGEAEMVLEKAMASGLLKDEHKERTTRLLNSLKTRADADKKGLPALDAEATKNPAGQLDVKLGEVYFGSGDYPNTVTAINRGLQKGQIKQLDEAYVYLGRAQAALKNNADAKKAFAGLKTVPNISPRVLKLWELYADELGH
jgi:tetratricopeptide (TPR) repeat protein